MDSVKKFELQIIYTQIDRDKDSVILTEFPYQVNDSNYFYPASTVKIITAVLTLEKLQQMKSIDLYSRFYVEGDSIETTFANEISKIFTVSDNEANNRLLEFLGQDYINTQLKNKHISPVRISHRLSAPNAFEITTTPLIAYLNDSTTTPLRPTINKTAIPLALNGISKGSGYYDENQLIVKPFDFSLKNYYPLNTQFQVLKRIIFPELYKKEDQFQLGEAERDFLIKAMCTLPKEMGYDTNEYYDGYGKFFMYGDHREAIPTNIKIYNKAGSAYGTLTDCAYIIDKENNIEFMLAATILVNKNGTYNDNEYEYETIGLPFLAQLGREIYKLELLRK
ncbi:serine hydrolase [Arenibacter sp. H213]|uniref:Serine hydrolase n=1 Tax=Arenibacter antarcticus TaxID=2040469 RepID=A0ABW5VMG3_9FLAO|nr:serine hydrolase [Arenibacter sp. H213]